MKKSRLLSPASLALLLAIAHATCGAKTGAAAEAADTLEAQTPAPTAPVFDPNAPVPPVTTRDTTRAAAPPSAPAAMTPGSVWLGVNGGVSLPFGDFSDQASTGFNLGLTGDYVIYENLAVGGEIGWHSFGGNDELEKELSVEHGASANLTIRVVPVIAHARYFLPAGQKVTPFVKGGLGLYNVQNKVEYLAVSQEHSSTRIGFQFGAGADFKSAASLQYGIDAQYLYIATENKATSMVVARGQLLFGLPRK